MSKPLLQVVSLTKWFGGVVAVNAIDIVVNQGEIVGLIGPNGAGKSTLFGMVTGFLKPTAGTVHFRGEDITALPPHRRSMLGIVCLFQKTAIFRDVTVFQAVRMGQHRRTSAGVLDALIGTARHRCDEETTRERAAELLTFLDLQYYSNQISGSLSYGQQRWVALAIALAADPDLLLLDEPAAGLNPTESAQLVDIVRAVRNRGTTILLVEHDMSVTMQVSDRIYVIASGNKIAEGSPAQVQENPAVIEAYLGSAYAAG